MLFAVRPVRLVKNLQRPICHHSDSALHILSGCEHQIISGRHNIACRLIMKAIGVGSSGGCFVRIDIGSKYRLALHKIPLESTNRTVPKRLCPRRFPSKPRRNTCRPDARKKKRKRKHSYTLLLAGVTGGIRMPFVTKNYVGSETTPYIK